MQILITAKSINITDAIEAYVNKKMNGLDKFFPNIIRANVVVGVENRHHLKGPVFICECKLEVPGNDLFASKNEKTLYKAIDKVRDYLENELKKHKSKLRGNEKKARRIARKTKEYKGELY